MAIETSIKILETIEWFLKVILMVCIAMGMWFIGVFIGNLLCGEVSIPWIAVIGLISICLTWIVTQLHLSVLCWRLEIQSDLDMMEKSAQEQGLYEHLMEGVYGYET